MIGTTINTLAEYINQLPDSSPIKQEYFALIMQRQALQNAVRDAISDLNCGRTHRGLEILKITHEQHGTKASSKVEVKNESNCQ